MPLMLTLLLYSTGKCQQIDNTILREGTKYLVERRECIELLDSTNAIVDTLHEAVAVRDEQIENLEQQVLNQKDKAAIVGIENGSLKDQLSAAQKDKESERKAADRLRTGRSTWRTIGIASSSALTGLITLIIIIL
jgi:hypothetical protein